MQTYKVDIDRFTARELWRKYRDHPSFEAPCDAEIRRCYQLMAQGKLVIKALESIKRAGLDEQGRPKLAICRADATHCWVDLRTDGWTRFKDKQSVHYHETTHYVEMPEGTFARSANFLTARAIVPIVPAYLRPPTPLRRFHILWEADWTDVPTDPYLLRRIGKADLWLVLAQWDLTEVERAVLSTRVRG